MGRIRLEFLSSDLLDGMKQIALDYQLIKGYLFHEVTITVFLLNCSKHRLQIQ